MTPISALTARALLGRSTPSAQRYALGTTTLTQVRGKWYVDEPNTPLVMALGQPVTPLRRRTERPRTWTC